MKKEENKINKKKLGEDNSNENEGPEEVRNAKGRMVQEISSKRLYFYMIYRVMRKNQLVKQYQEENKKRFSVKEILEQMREEYAIKMDQRTIQRSLGGACYGLFRLNEDAKKLIPFRIYCLIPFDEKLTEENFYKTYLPMVETEKKDTEDILKDINAYFPIKKDKEGNLKEIELHFPISDEEEEKFGEFLEQLLEVFNSKKKNKKGKDKNTNKEENGHKNEGNENDKAQRTVSAIEGAYYFNAQAKYGIEEEILNDVEQKLLMDAVEGYSYISSNDTRELMEKLERISTGVPLNNYIKNKIYNTESKVESVAGADGEMFFENFKTVRDCIVNKQKMKIMYGKYVHDKKNNKPKLENRSADVEYKIVSPYHTMWANGYYYLLVFYEGRDKIIALRMDRILYAEPMLDEKEEAVKIEQEFPDEYKVSNQVNEKRISTQKIKNQSLVMHVDEPVEIKFRCKSYMLNNVVDSFGFDVNIQEFDEDEIKTQKFLKKENWVEVKTVTSVRGAALWLTQYCADSYAVEPKELVDTVKENLTKGTNYYQ